VFKSVAEARISTVDNRWDEKAGLQRDVSSSQVIDALEAQEIEETGDEEAYPMTVQRTLNKQDEHLTIGLDLGDRSSFYCVLMHALSPRHSTRRYTESSLWTYALR
jgi:hypothetical protein